MYCYANFFENQPKCLVVVVFLFLILTTAIVTFKSGISTDMTLGFMVFASLTGEMLQYILLCEFL